MRQRWIGWVCLLGMSWVSAAAHAEPNAEQRRLIAKRKSERYEFDTPYDIRGGAARIVVKASAAETEKSVTDYGDYAKFISKFEKSRIVGRSGGNTDVYLQVPIMKGAAKIWAVLRFEPAKNSAEGRTVEAHMLKGNVKRLDAKWRIVKIDDANTQLNCEMIIIPKFPLPESVIVGEVAYAADVAVTGARDHAEHKH